MEQRVKVGQSLTKDGIIYTVVRVVSEDTSLVREEDGQIIMLTESYAQLAGPMDEVDFILFESKREHFSDQGGKALDAKMWRRT